MIDEILKGRLKEKEKLEITQQQEKEYKLTYQSTIHPHFGHTVFEIDVETLEVRLPEYEQTDYVFDPFWQKGKRPIVEAKIIRKEGCVYIAALNRKNALKNFHKGINGSKIDPNKEYLKL